MNVNVNVSTSRASRAVFVKPVKSEKLPDAPEFIDINPATPEPVRTLTVNQKKAVIARLDSILGEGKGKWQTGAITRHFGVFHWSQVPAARFLEVMNFISHHFRGKKSRKATQRVKSIKPSQVWQDENHPAAPVDPETQIFFAAEQFRNYQKRFTEQAELMEFCAASCEKTYRAIKGQYLR